MPAFLGLAAVLAGVFLWVSNSIVTDLAIQERERMEVWAAATKALVSAEEADAGEIDLLLKIIEGNRTIPVLLADENGKIMSHRNIALPEAPDSLNPLVMTERNREYLERKLGHLKHSGHVINVELGPGMTQYLYYEDSRLLKMLNYYPYIQLIVVLVMVGIGYYAVVSAKKAEQNKVWAGLSKETAHQLGTPISSLMAWMELLESSGVDQAVTDEMNKDVKRLSTIASRFGKIGSRPVAEEADLNTVVREAARYMATRISRKIKLDVETCPEPLTVMVSTPLVEWVIENLIKNAVDAMDASGSVTVVTSRERNSAIIEVTDTGKGIARNRQKQIFNPGYTTKKRGWGLGLTLAKRIVEEYHRGRIYVAWSEPGRGTTFRIIIPMAHQDRCTNGNT